MASILDCYVTRWQRWVAAGVGAWVTTSEPMIDYIGRGFILLTHETDSRYHPLPIAVVPKRNLTVPSWID
jgi:hypothetical protein